MARPVGGLDSLRTGHPCWTKALKSILGVAKNMTVLDSDSSETRMLSRAEEKFRLLFEKSPLGMAMVDHATGEFLEVNCSVLQSTGYTREEFLQLSFWQITPQQYAEQEIAQIKELNRVGQFGPNEKEYIRKDGTRYPIKISGSMMTNTDGRKVV